MSTFNLGALQSATFRIAFLLLLATLTAATLSAQKTVGLRAGITTTSFKPSGEIDEDFDSGSGLGYYGELNFNLPFGASGFGFTPLVGFNFMQTATYSTELGAANQFPLTVFGIEKGTDQFNTITMGGLFRYSFQGKSISPFFEMGPWVNLFLNGKTTLEGQELRRRQDNTVDYFKLDQEEDIEFGSSSNDVYRKNSFSWAFGTGLKADFDFGTLMIGARYIGVGDFRSKESLGGPAGLRQQFLAQDGILSAREYGSDDKLKLRTLQVTVGYAFPLGGY